jgi:hypothetical protein
MAVKGVDSASGFALGLLGTAVLINFMRGGIPQVKQWGKAKFTNGIAAAGSPTTPTPALPPQKGLGGIAPKTLPGGGGPNPAPGGGANGWGK